MANHRGRGLILNIVPITFSEERIRIGRIPCTTREAYGEQRTQFRETHAFRLDALSSDIINVALVAGTEPVGAVEDAPIAEHLLLIAKSVQQSIVAWLAGGKVPILKGPKNLIFWGRGDSVGHDG